MLVRQGQLLGGGVAGGVLLGREGDELTAGRGGCVAAGGARYREDAVRETGLPGVGELPGAVLGERVVAGRELLPAGGLGVVEDRVGGVAGLQPVLPEGERRGPGRSRAGQLGARTPEPRQELEAALLGADRGEGDALLAGLLHLRQGRRERRPVLHRGDVHSRAFEDLLVVVEREGVGADGGAVRLAAGLAGREEVGVDLRGVELVLLGRGEDSRLGQRGDDRVVDDEDVRGVALLGGEQGLVRRGRWCRRRSA
ncbi:hypothetical protein SGRIM119S_06324 [Streptomyces griseorubiginosus]